MNGNPKSRTEPGGNKSFETWACIVQVYIAHRTDIILLAVSISMSVVFAATGHITFHSDSEQYLSSALAILGESPGKFYYYRILGYPLLMLLTGTLLFGTFLPLIIVQCLASGMIPWLVYRTILLVAPRFALPCSILCIVSFSPYFLMTVIMTDQVAMTLMYAAILFIVRFVRFLRRGDILKAVVATLGQRLSCNRLSV